MFRTLIAKIAATAAITAAGLTAFALADTVSTEPTTAQTAVIASDTGSDSDPWN